MKKKFQILFIVIWLLMVGVLLGYFVFGVEKGEKYSEEENRMLADLPDMSLANLANGNFENSVEAFLLDRFAARPKVISFVNKLKDTVSVADYDDYLAVMAGPVDLLTEETDEEEEDLAELFKEYLNTADRDTSDAKEDTSAGSESGEIAGSDAGDTAGENATGDTEGGAENVPLPEPEYPPIIEKPAADIADYPKTVGAYIRGDKKDSALVEYTTEQVLTTTAVLNSYARCLPENGKLLFTMVPQAYMGNKYVGAKNKQGMYSNYTDVVNAFGDNNVYAVDAAKILSESIDAGNYTYFRTDMHWTPYGAYLVYREMATLAGKTPVDYENDFTHQTEEPFLGTYYRDNPSDYMKNNADSLELLTPKTDFSFWRITGKDEKKELAYLNFNAKANDRYTIYLSGPAGPWTYAEMDNDETENCLVIMDSFGLCYYPMVMGNYKQIHYYDPRYFDEAVVGYSVAELIEKYEIHDIYVVIGDIHAFSNSFLTKKAKEQLYGNNS